MKNFLLLVQEMEVKKPAPAYEVVAYPPPMVLHRCLVLTALLSCSSNSWNPTYNHWLCYPPFSATSPASIGPLLCTCTQERLPPNWAPDGNTTKHDRRFCGTSQIL